MKSLSLTIPALVAASLMLVACGNKEDAKTRAMKSAGGLSEGRHPPDRTGVTPAPTGATKNDKKLEAGWSKTKGAKLGEKPPSASDRSSL